MNWFAFLVDSDSDFPVSLVSLVSLLSWADAVTGWFAPHMAMARQPRPSRNHKNAHRAISMHGSHGILCATSLVFLINVFSLKVFLRLQVFLINLQDMLMYPFHFPWEIPHLGKIRFILIATSAKIVNLSGRIKDSFLGPRSSSLHRSSSTWTPCLQEELCIKSASIDQWPWRVQQFLNHLWSEQILGQVWTHPSHIMKANQWRFKVQTRPRMTTVVSTWKVHIFTWMHSTTTYPGLGR